MIYEEMKHRGIDGQVVPGFLQRSVELDLDASAVDVHPLAHAPERRGDGPQEERIRVNSSVQLVLKRQADEIDILAIPAGSLEN